jgi:vacuolar protein sorting-associated protein 13B
VSGTSADNGWGMWAWNTVSSFLPMDWQNDWSNEQHIAYSGHVVHFGFYIDNATITFKVGKFYYKYILYVDINFNFNSSCSRLWKV